MLKRVQVNCQSFGVNVSFLTDSRSVKENEIDTGRIRIIFDNDQSIKPGG